MKYLRYWWDLWVGWQRVYWGFCPSCNSSAPELDTCDTCYGYHSAKGHPYPPPKSLKEAWWESFKHVPPPGIVSYIDHSIAGSKVRLKPANESVPWLQSVE